MSQSRTAQPRKRKASIQRNVGDGKENALPGTIPLVQSRGQKKGEEAILKKRLSLSSNEQTTDARSSRFSDFPATKTRFPVHRDDKVNKGPGDGAVSRSTQEKREDGKVAGEGAGDLRESRATKKVPGRTKIPMRVDRPRMASKVTVKEVAANAEGSVADAKMKDRNELEAKQDVGKNDQKTKPIQIRRANSAAENPPKLQTRNERAAAWKKGNRGCSMPPLTEKKSGSCRSAAVLPSRKTLLTRDEKGTKTLKREPGQVGGCPRRGLVPIPGRKGEEKSKGTVGEDKRAKSITSAPRISRSKFPGPVESGEPEKRAKPEEKLGSSSAADEHPLVVKRFTANPRGSVITPVDGPPPLPPLPVKAIIRQAKQEAENALNPAARSSDVRSVDPFPVELAFHLDYLEDLPFAEQEREERSPVLSNHFLRRNIDVHQRRQIVIYLIHLSSHCRYPSYIVYQTVKMFDALMDRFPVEIFYLQLTALAVLWICLKRQENFYKIPSASTIVALARELYFGREDLLISYERKVLRALDFQVSFPDAHSMLAYFLMSCRDRIRIPEGMTKFVYNCAGYLIDLTLLDESLCRVPASMIAITAAELAVDFADQGKPRCCFRRVFLTDEYPDHVRFQDEDISRLRSIVTNNVLLSGEKRSGFDVVYKKYNRSRYGRISERVVQCARKIFAIEES